MADYTKKQWGHELIWADTKEYSARMFVVLEGNKTPYIYHKKMDTTIFILQGMVQLTTEGQNRVLNAGDKFHIPPNIMHCIVALKNDAVILEAGTAIEDDIVEVEK